MAHTFINGTKESQQGLYGLNTGGLYYSQMGWAIFSFDKSNYFEAWMLGLGLTRPKPNPSFLPNKASPRVEKCKILIQRGKNRGKESHPENFLSSFASKHYPFRFLGNW